MPKNPFRNAPVLLLTLLLPMTAPSRSNAAEQKLWRYAIVVGANDGGYGRSQLRYAHKDAKEVAAVLKSYGGVQKEDLILLLDPDRFAVESAFATMRKLIENTKQSGVRQEVLIYYSGHSDEQGILLGGDDLPYRELKASIADLPADVRIAILDSCASGAMARTKGGVRKAPFMVDSSVDVEGHAFMTSASADEAAQESDKIGGSFFTHYLTTGLRGAADADNDHIVTLNEAYNYAFNETLAKTETTLAGPQHANYDFQLKGSGDLVLTDLRGTAAVLGVAEGVIGHIFIRNSRGRLVAEINKAGAQSVNLGLDPGNYTVTLENSEGLFKGTVAVSTGKATVIRRDDLDRQTKEITTTRGQTAVVAAVDNGQTSKEEVIQRPIQFGLFPGGISLMPLNRPEGPKQTYFAINFIGDGHYLNGMEFGMLGSIRYYDVNGLQTSGLFNFNTANTRGLQVSGLFNMNKGRMTGLQASGLFNLNGEGRGLFATGLFNLSRGPSQGLHAAGLFNYVEGPTRGFTASGLFNMTGSSSHGYLGAGLFNFNRSASNGFMGAGLLNINGGAYHGFQGAGLVNVSARDTSTGFQAAGLANYGQIVKGYQTAGLLNVASESMVGLQTGVINIGGDVKGAQIGVVNIATGELKGAQIGLVNVGGGLYLSPTFWTSGSSFINMGLKFGGRFTHAILGYGVHPQKGEKRSSLIYGFGGHIDLDRFWLELDGVVHHLMADYHWTKNEEDMVYKFRPTLGFRLLDQLTLFAGPSLNLMVSDIRKEASVIPNFWSHTSDDGTHLGLSIDFTVGFQWEPRFGNINRIQPINRVPQKAAPVPAVISQKPQHVISI